MEWVRPVISIMGMIGLMAGFFIGKITAEAFILAVGVTVTWWFKSRDDEKKNGA